MSVMQEFKEFVVKREAAAAPPPTAEDVLLLREIRDALKH